jgi:hypothetical protein
MFRESYVGSQGSDRLGGYASMPAMNVPDQPLSHEVLEHAHAYVRVDQHVVASLPELCEAIRSFEPVPSPAGKSVAEWLVGRALNESLEATIRVRLNYGKITGVYALCAAQIALSREERATYGKSGDGGNRTHVRNRVKDGFYERSRRSDLVLR